jgi:hypothetical protein
MIGVAYLLYFGGIYHIGWAIFDLFWPRFFNWKVTLANLDDFNRAVLYISGRLLVLLYIYLAGITIYFGPKLLMTDLGKTILVFIVIYWTFRAIMQIQFFGFRKANTLNIKISDGKFPWPINKMSNQSLSALIFGIMIIGILLHLLPLLLVE